MNTEPLHAELPDIESREDIVRLMHEFYGRMFKDEVMGPIFLDVAKMNLETHIPIISDFWELQLFQKSGYRGGMMMVHFQLHNKMPEGLEHHHFMRWLDYWYETLDSMFEGPRANWAKVVASRIGNNMSTRIDEVTGRTAAQPPLGQIRLK